MVRDVARLLLGATVAIVLLLVVVRPLLKSLVHPARGHAAAPALPGGAVVGASEQLASPAGAPQVAGPGAARPRDYEQQVAAAKTLVAQDPKRVAQVVKNWVGTDE